MGSFTFSAGLLRSLETFQVELLEQNLEHSKCLKTASPLLSEGDSPSQHLEAPPRFAPSWECLPGTLDGIPDGCPAVGSSGAPTPCSCLGREWHASASLLAPAQPQPLSAPPLPLGLN